MWTYRDPSGELWGAIGTNRTQLALWLQYELCEAAPLYEPLCELERLPLASGRTHRRLRGLWRDQRLLLQGVRLSELSTTSGTRPERAFRRELAMHARRVQKLSPSRFERAALLEYVAQHSGVDPATLMPQPQPPPPPPPQQSEPQSEQQQQRPPHHEPEQPPPSGLPQIEAWRPLLGWFKDYFPYNHATCSACGEQGYVLGDVRPSARERSFDAARCELQRCGHCGHVSRFPRYNSVAKVLETRQGRCGEYSAVMLQLALALGWRARIVVDWTDHLWVEVWVPDPPADQQLQRQRQQLSKVPAEEAPTAAVGEVAAGELAEGADGAEDEASRREAAAWKRRWRKRGRQLAEDVAREVEAAEAREAAEAAEAAESAVAAADAAEPAGDSGGTWRFRLRRRRATEPLAEEVAEEVAEEAEQTDEAELEDGAEGGVTTWQSRLQRLRAAGWLAEEVGDEEEEEEEYDDEYEDDENGEEVGVVAVEERFAGEEAIKDGRGAWRRRLWRRREPASEVAEETVEEVEEEEVVTGDGGRRWRVRRWRRWVARKRVDGEAEDGSEEEEEEVDDDDDDDEASGSSWRVRGWRRHRAAVQKARVGLSNTRAGRWVAPPTPAAEAEPLLVTGADEAAGGAREGAAAQSGGRWVMLDPCEAALDEPQLYAGWGKNHTYVIALGGGSGMSDVTPTYAADMAAVLERRQLSPAQVARAMRWVRVTVGGLN